MTPPREWPTETKTCRECGEEFDGMAGTDDLCDDCSDVIAEAEDQEDNE